MCDIGAFDNGGSPNAARLAAFTVTRSGHTVVFHWRMVATRGIAGFNLLSGGQRLKVLACAALKSTVLI